MYRLLLLLILLLPATAGFCKKNNNVITTIDGQPISKEEFVRLYKKNNDQVIDQGDKKTPEQYLDLFINFKLKVLEAERLKYDTVPSFINELKKYRADLAKPYLTSVHYTDNMVKTEYDRMQSEIDASHILLRLPPNPSPADTLKAWNKIMDIRKQILNGANFGEMAIKYSKDPSAKQNKGHLGYFSALQMVFPFESMAYNTPVDSVSMPVRTTYGYHLIKVIGKRPSKGQMKVAHIMKRLAMNSSEETIKQQKEAIDSLANLIKNGADFAKLAKENSDDRKSASQGGKLPWFSSTGIMPEFGTPAFALKNNGDVSPVIRTPYGWHIIKRLDYRPPESFDKMKEFLTDKIRRNPEISQHSQKIFISKLKKEYQFKQDDAAIDKAVKEVQQILKNGNPGKFSLPDSSSVLFSFADEKATAGEFEKYLATNVEIKNQPSAHHDLTKKYEGFASKTLVDYEDAHLSAKYPDFKYLLQEYHDGILLFNISQDKIWDKAAKDTVGLEAFYNKDKKYLWGERFKGFIIKCNKQEVKDFIDGVFTANPEVTETELKDQLKERFGDTQTEIKLGAFEKGDNELVDYLVWNGPKPDGYNSDLDFIHGNKVAPEPKTLDKARGLYISDYQNYLEAQWVKDLRKKHKVKVNKKVLKSIKPVS